MPRRFLIPRTLLLGSAALSASLALSGCGTKTERIYVPGSPTTAYSWKSQHPLPLGTRSFASVFGASPHDIYAVGSEGVIAHFDGTSWSLMESGIYTDLQAVWAAEGTACASGGWYLMRYDGERWSAQMTRWSFDAFWGLSPTDLWAIDGDEVFRNDGSTWNACGLSDSNFYFADLWGSAPNDVYCVGWDRILHYDGAEWKMIEHGLKDPNFRGVGGSGPSDVWITGYNDTMLHYTGGSWESIVNPVRYYSRVVGVSGTSPADMYFGIYSDFYRSAVLRYDGSIFTDVTDYDVVREVNDIWAAGDTVVCVGDYGSIAMYDGSSWSDAQGGPYADLHDVWSDGAANAWAVGDNGAILHYDGSSWTALQHPSLEPNGLQAVDGTSDNLYAVGYLGTVLHYDGITVRDISDIGVTTSKLCDVWSAGNEAFAVGYGGTIIHMNGNTISAMSSPTSRILLGVWGSSPYDVFAVGQRGTILHYDGIEWSAMVTPDTLSELTGAWGTARDNVYVCGSYNLLRYDGRSWSIIALRSNSGLQSIWGSSASDVWVLASNRSLLHFDGIAWSSTFGFGLTSARLYAISGSASDNVFAVGQRGTIIHYGP